MELAALCDRCLGRRLAGARGDVQWEAAAAWRAEQGVAQVPEAECPVCEGQFAHLGKWVEAALAALSGREFSTFQVGSVFPKECEDREKAMMGLVPGENTESLRTEANRLLAAELAGRTAAEPMPEGRADVVVVVDTRFWHAEARANSVFLRGRYTKHRRDLPQTHWPCKRCQGRGCYECDDAGVMYASSVEDVVAGPAKEAYGASEASFHGAGREDIDALMLGTGRPFVLELHDPRRRDVDLGAIEAGVNAQTARSGVGVLDLRPAVKEEVAQIKAAEYEKEYLAHCVADAPVARADVESTSAGLCGTQLAQRTPERVSHRRADKVRRRTVHEVRVEAMAEDPGPRFSLRVRAESGTYIKEFVSGDEGRTEPCFAGRLGVPCRVAFLDVVGVLDEGPGPLE